MQSPLSGIELHVKKSTAGLGLYTAEPIRKGTTIIEYVGERIPTSLDRSNRYIFNVNTRWDIDGSARSNTARYINHSCRPNCEPIERKGRIFAVAKRNIRSGEELTYNYGKEYFDAYIRPHGCRCVKCNEKK
jgi:SET domain-containing protein